MENVPDLLYALRDAVRLDVIPARWLPTIAAEMLVDGLDSPSLRELAGLDLAPFTSPDATDLLRTVMGELGAPDDDRPENGTMVAQLLACAALRHELDTPTVLNRYYRLAVALDYPDDLMRLYGMEDAWHGGWGPTQDEIERDIKAILTDLAASAPEFPQWITDAAAGPR